MKMLTIAALLAGAMMLSWAVAASEPAYAIDTIPGESKDDKHSDWIEIFQYAFGSGAKTLPGIGTSPK